MDFLIPFLAGMNLYLIALNVVYVKKEASWLKVIEELKEIIESCDRTIDAHAYSIVDLYDRLKTMEDDGK